MTSKQNDEAAPGIEKKNLKNIYVKKINSMMKLSNQNLIDEKLQISTTIKTKKIEKVKSQLINQDDKNTDKLYKNRISAKRARLRKKLYIKLLETQVAQLKDINENGKRIQKQSSKFLEMINRKQSIKQKIEDEVQRYLSREDLTGHKQSQKQSNSARMDKVIEQICQISMPSSLKNIRKMSSQISLEQILKNQKDAQKLQIILKSVMDQSEELTKIFMKINVANQNVKNCIEQQSMKDDEFLDNFQMFNDEIQEKRQKKRIDKQDFCNYYEKPSNLGVFINLIEAQRILIQASTFLDITGVQKDQII